MTQKSDFKVIIAGGSVSGLTLAHSLYHAGIDFVVLERGSEISFGGGASIGLQPNGLRVLDQLGMYDSILAITKGIHEAVHRRSDGSVIARSNFAAQVEERYGYPILFFERSELLQILYDHLPESCKKKVFTSHEVISVETTEFGATVTTKNGAKFKGDIVVGADGINSTVRRSMWDMIKLKDPKRVQKAETSMTSQYYCAFGVSIHDFKDPDLVAGTSQIVENEGCSNIVITSTKSRVFWFVVLKHDKIYTYPNIPKFTYEQSIAIMNKEAPNFRATEKTSMKDIWDNHTKFALVSLEEVIFDDWSHGRVVLLGDAAHKVTPNAGHGGNTALESSTVLVNLLYDAKTGTKGSLDYQGLQNIFKEYRQIRKQRVESVVEASSAATRIQALEGPGWKAVSALASFLGEELEVNASSDMIMGGQALKFIDYKGRSGNTPWEGWAIDDIEDDLKSFYDSKIIRFLGTIFAFAIWFVRQVQVSGDSPVSTSSMPYGFDSSRIFNFFLGFNESKLAILPGTLVSEAVPNKIWPAFFACMNLLPVGVIVSIEGSRSNNAKSLSNMLWLAGITMQLGGLSVLAPLLLFVHCVDSNLSTREPKGYILPLRYAQSLLTATLVTAAIPLLLALNAPGLVLGGNFLSQILLTKIAYLFPLLPYLITQFWGQIKSSKARTVVLGHEDVWHIQLVLVLSTLISALSHFADILLVALSAIRGKTTGPILDMVISKKASDSRLYLMLTAASVFWCSVTALRVLPPQKRTLNTKFQLMLRVVAGSVLVGPGAAMSLLWLWREDKTRCMEAQWRYAAEKELKKDSPST